MSDDSRHLLDKFLPGFCRDLAVLIDNHGPTHSHIRHIVQRNGGKNVWGFYFKRDPSGLNSHQLGLDHSKPWRRDTKLEDGKEVHYYYGVARSGGDTHSWIRFENLRLTKILKTELGSLDVIDQGSGGSQVTENITNGGPTEIPLRMRSETESEKEEYQEHSFSVMVGSEYRMKMTREAGGSFAGIEAKAELEQELTMKMEANTAHEWRKSTRLKQVLEREMNITIAPQHKFSMITDQSEKKVKQDVLVTGELEASVTLYSHFWDYPKTWDCIEDLLNTLRGIRPGHGAWGEWYAHSGRGTPETAIRAIELPTLTLNLPIRANRTRYSNLVIAQTPLAGGASKPYTVPDEYEGEF